MVLPENIHPENTLYYNGALILELLQKEKEVEFLELYSKIKKKKDMTFSIFVLCLDWLYLIDLAELKNGIVELCL